MWVLKLFMSSLILECFLWVETFSGSSVGILWRWVIVVFNFGLVMSYGVQFLLMIL